MTEPSEMGPENALVRFDGRTVRITDCNDIVFEGECEWLPEEYVEAEIGGKEEALQIDDWVFYPSYIKDVREIPPGSAHVWENHEQHCMRLAPEPFKRIEDGTKTVDIRLNDEKRRRLRVGDVIRFESTEDPTDVLRTKVMGLHTFPSFSALYAALPLTALGYAPEELGTASPEDMRRYYTPEQEAQYGVLSIRLEIC